MQVNQLKPHVANRGSGSLNTAKVDLKQSKLLLNLQELAKKLPIRLVALPHQLSDKNAARVTDLHEHERGIHDMDTDLVSQSTRIITRLQSHALTVELNGSVKNTVGHKTGHQTKNQARLIQSPPEKAKRAVVNHVFELEQLSSPTSLLALKPLFTDPNLVLYLVGHGGPGEMYASLEAFSGDEPPVTSKALALKLDRFLNSDPEENPIDKASIKATFKIASCLSGRDLKQKKVKVGDNVQHVQATDDGHSRKMSRADLKRLHRAEKKREQIANKNEFKTDSNFAAQLHAYMYNIGYINVNVRGYDGFIGEFVNESLPHSYIAQGFEELPKSLVRASKKNERLWAECAQIITLPEYSDYARTEQWRNRFTEKCG